MKKGKSKYFPFEKARDLVREECLTSISVFNRWHKHNNPNKIPNRPDAIYAAHGWISWNDFLGNNNKFLNLSKNYIPYDQAKKYSRSLGMNSGVEWRRHCTEGKCPPNIPHRPDYYYEEWFTWKDWLGKDTKQIVKEMTQNPPVLFVIKTNTTPPNVFKVNVTYGGKEALMEAVRQGARVIDAFDNRTNADWRSLLSRYASSYTYGEADDFMFSNVNGFLFDISNILPKYR